MSVPNVSLPFVPRTKLRRPRLADDVLMRTRLLEKLDCAETPTLVVAPAGYGKTTLVSSWLAQVGHPYAWLSLEGDDSALDRFLAGLVAALRRMFPEFGGEVLDLLQTKATELTPALVLHSLLNALATIDRHFVLVLDDYHHIVDSSIHQVLWGILLHPLRHMHLVLTARHDPPLPPRIRLQGSLNEIRARDLRFQETETQAFLAQYAARPLDTQSVAAFTRLSEGWAVPLRLMAIVMRQRKDVTSIEEALHRCDGFLLDYLDAEVIGHLPADIQTFLTHTSTLGWLNASLCDAVIKASLPSIDSAITLRMLVDAGIFVEPLDESGDWFRYHELFRTLLLHRLRRTHGEQLVEALEQRAKAWLEQHGLSEVIESAVPRPTAVAEPAQSQNLLRAVLPVPPAMPSSSRMLPVALPAAHMQHTRTDLLTFREMDVMELLSQRLTNKEIARILSISHETVRQHTVNIYRKLGVENRRQAVVQAHAWGLIPICTKGKRNLDDPSVRV